MRFKFVNHTLKIGYSYIEVLFYINSNKVLIIEYLYNKKSIKMALNAGKTDIEDILNKYYMFI